LPSNTTFWFFPPYFVKNVARNFRNQGCLSINYQLKMHTSLRKGRGNSPTATRDKEGGLVTAARGHDTTALAAYASGLEIDWPLSSSRAGMSHDPFKRDQMLVHRNSMHDNITQPVCLLRALFLRRLLAIWIEYWQHFP
jgi:hypothetical protein